MFHVQNLFAAKLPLAKHAGKMGWSGGYILMMALTAWLILNPSLSHPLKVQKNPFID
jgi:hypothetical protein